MADGAEQRVSVITPTFNNRHKRTQRSLPDHRRSTVLPVLLYSNPGRTGVTISVELASRLAQIDNIAGIKDSSGDLSTTAAFIAGTPDRFKVFAGRDTLVFATVLYGGAGAVAASGNVAARHLVRLYNACRAGDLELARDTQAAVAPLRAAFSLGTFPAVIKEALRMTGLDAALQSTGRPLNEQRGRNPEGTDELGLLRGSESDILRRMAPLLCCRVHLSS
jgi:4-hydroxy-tetrahydrodipicolinate synthase